MFRDNFLVFIMIDCDIAKDVPLSGAGEFVGGYALVNGSYFVDGHGRAYKRRRANVCDEVLELIPGGFAIVRTHSGEILYRDYVTDILWADRPEGFIKMDFLHFFKYGGLYYLRIPTGEHTVAFCEGDMWIHGDAVQRRNALGSSETVFIHRSMPHRVFRFMGYNKDLSKRLMPYGNDMYYYTYKKGGKRPVRTNETIPPMDSEERIWHIHEYMRIGR